MCAWPQAYITTQTTIFALVFYGLRFLQEFGGGRVRWDWRGWCSAVRVCDCHLLNRFRSWSLHQTKRKMEKLLCIGTTILVLTSFNETGALITNVTSGSYSFNTSRPTTATSDWTVSVTITNSSIVHQEETSTAGWTSIPTTAATEMLTSPVRDNQTVKINIEKDVKENPENKEKGETTESKTEDAPKPLGRLIIRGLIFELCVIIILFSGKL